MCENSIYYYPADATQTLGVPLKSSSACTPQENHNKLITGRPPVALDMKLYKGMRLHITRNVNKEADFINGMECVVETYEPKSKCVHVKTKTKLPDHGLRQGLRLRDGVSHQARIRKHHPQAAGRGARAHHDLVGHSWGQSGRIRRNQSGPAGHGVPPRWRSDSVAFCAGHVRSEDRSLVEGAYRQRSSFTSTVAAKSTAHIRRP